MRPTVCYWFVKRHCFFLTKKRSILKHSINFLSPQKTTRHSRWILISSLIWWVIDKELTDIMPPVALIFYLLLSREMSDFFFTPLMYNITKWKTINIRINKLINTKKGIKMSYKVELLLKISGISSLAT